MCIYTFYTANMSHRKLCKQCKDFSSCVVLLRQLKQLVSCVMICLIKNDKLWQHNHMCFNSIRVSCVCKSVTEVQTQYVFLTGFQANLKAIQTKGLINSKSNAY